MKLKPLLFAALLALLTQGLFAKGIRDEYNNANNIPQELDAENCCNQGRVFLGIGYYYFAIGEFNQALKLKPDYADAFFGRGEANFQLGNYDMAKEDFSLAINADPKYTGAYIYRGLLYRKEGNFDRAIADMTMLLELNPGFAIAREQLAELYFERGADKVNSGNIDGGIEDFILSCRFDPENAEAWYHMGVLYLNLNNYAEAEACLLESKNIWGKTLGREHLYYAGSLNYLGDLYLYTSRYTEAEACYLEAKSIWEKAPDRENSDYALLLNNMGAVYQHLGSYAKSASLYLEAIELHKKIFGNEHPEYAASLNNLGGLYSSMGDFAKAVEYFQEAKKIWEKAPEQNYLNYTKLLNNLGGLFHKLGDNAKAETYYLEAMDIREKTLGRDHPEYAASLNNLGGLYSSIGDFAKAETLLLKAKNILEEAPDRSPVMYAASLNNLGLLYMRMGNKVNKEADRLDRYISANEYYLGAKTILEKTLNKEHPDYAISLNNLGDLYQLLGNLTRAEEWLLKAESCYLEARDIREKKLGKEHPDNAQTINSLGALYNNLGNYIQAENCYIESKKILEKAFGKNHPDYVTSLNNLTSLYIGTKEFPRVLEFKSEANQLNLILLKHDFSFLSEQQREAYWEDNTSSFEATYSLSHFYPVPETSALSYDNALFTKGLLLRTANAVRDAINNSGDQTLIAQYNELGRLRQQIGNLRQSGNQNETYIQSLEQQAEAKDKFLTQASADYRNFQNDLTLNWQKVRDSLQANEAAIEFVSFKLYDKKWTDKTLYAALVLRLGMEAPEWIPLCEESTLAELFKQSDGSDIQVYKEPWAIYDSPALYEAIWQPLEKALEGVKKVYYSPSGLLHKISFNGILVSGNGEQGETRLVDIYDLNLVSSTREVALKQRKTSVKPASAVVYGGLLYDLSADRMRAEALAYESQAYQSQAYQNQEVQIAAAASETAGSEGRGSSWRYLKGTQTESNNIQNQLNSSNIQSVLYNAARGNKESFKSLDRKKTGIIHIATHGFFLNDIEKNYAEMERLERMGGGKKAFENPLMKSGLILAGGNNAWSGNPVPGVENGILFADDVARMNLLGAELVVLSACETGLGDVKNGEGVFGLQRAFKLAGAETLIMSLWIVSDQASKDMMIEFYKNWLSGENKQEAFKEAQKLIRGQYQHPYFWAAFVLMD